jgi:hypothetical protein
MRLFRAARQEFMYDFFAALLGEIYAALNPDDDQTYSLCIGESR